MKQLFLLSALTVCVFTSSFSQTWKNYPYPEPYDSVFKIVEVHTVDSLLWVKAQRSINFLSGWKNQLEDKYLLVNQTGDIVAEKNMMEYLKVIEPAKNLWSSDRDSIFSYDSTKGKSFTVLPLATNEADSALFSFSEPDYIISDSKGGLYGEIGCCMGSYGHRIWYINPERTILKTTINNYNKFLLDKQDNLIVTNYDTIAILSKENLTKTQKATLPYSNLQLIEVDETNTIWMTGYSQNSGVKLISYDWSGFVEYDNSYKSVYTGLKHTDIYGNKWGVSNGKIYKLVNGFLTPFDFHINSVSVRYDDIESPCYTNYSVDYKTIIALKNGYPIVSNQDSTFYFNDCSISSDTALSWFLEYNTDLIGNDTEGAVVYKNNQWETVTSAYPDSTINLLIQDKQGVFWGKYICDRIPRYSQGGFLIGYNLYYGLVSYQNNQWTFHKEIESDLLEMFIDNQNIVWVLGTNQLSKYDGLSWSKYPLLVEIKPFEYSVVPDNESNIWLTDSYQGVKPGKSNVVKFNGQEWEKIVFPKLNASMVKFTDPDRGVWLHYEYYNVIDNISGYAIPRTQLEGLAYSVDGVEWTYYEEGVDILSANVVNMLADQDNNIWMSSGLGIMKFVRHEETTVGIQATETQNNQLTIYPNPVSDLLQLQGVEQGAIVSIFGADGQEISVHQTNQLIDVSELKTGVYILKIQSNQQVQSKQFIKL